MCLVCVFCAAATIASSADNFETLLSFNGTNGEFPYAPLVQGLNGNFYGTTNSGGAHGDYGTVFEITAAGKLATLHSFINGTDGEFPDEPPFEGLNGSFYGTTQHGGVHGYGTVFEITPEGKLTTLHSFDGTNGDGPAGLVQATDGNFYGTTNAGGATGAFADGTIFKITPAGTLMNFDKQVR
jgi:uncharacterized repeat protein (TIGR03803 family)